MNWKIVKLKWKLAKIIGLTGTCLWIAETLYFLIVNGWHWKSTIEAEKLLDTIVFWFWFAAIIIMLSVMIDIIEYLLNEREA